MAVTAASSLAVVPSGRRVGALPRLSSCSAAVRPLLAQDLGPLMSSVGVLVDRLYPSGALKLQERLADALNGYSAAFVVPDRNNRPIALASESFKGCRNAKLSTFWVHPSARGRGVGKALLVNRQISWIAAGYERVHVTVREERSDELEKLFLPRGFQRTLVVVGRYGEGQDEVVLTWQPGAVDDLCSPEIK